MRLSTRNSPLIMALPLLLIAARAAAAQDAVRSDQEKLGARLFTQSCGVCHLKQQIGTTSYAPALSQATLGGKAAIMHDVISDGSPHMPAFKIQFAPTQIDAIVAYIKTIPTPAAAPPPAKADGPGEAD